MSTIETVNVDDLPASAAIEKVIGIGANGSTAGRTLADLAGDLADSAAAMASIGSSATVTRAETGGVTVTVNDKIQEILSIKEFGAIGDGNAANASVNKAAFENAMAAAIEYSGVFVPPGHYVIDGEITIPKNNLTIFGNAKITAKASTNFEYMLKGTSRSGIKIQGLIFDVNKANRSSGQNVRFMGVGLLACTDCTVEDVTVMNARGYGGASAVGITVASQSARCKVAGCNLINCGDASFDSDGVFMSGDYNICSDSIAVSCTDTGFVIETSNASHINNVVCIDCAAGCAITNAGADHKRGNKITGATIHGWNGANTGAIQIGMPGNYTGNIYDTTIADVTTYADTTGNFGAGAAILSRGDGTGRLIGVRISNVTIRGGKNQGIYVKGSEYSINDCRISGVVDGCVQINEGSDHTVSNCHLANGSYGVVTQNSAEAYLTGNVYKSVGYAAYALDTSTIRASGDIVKSVTTSRYGKDAGGTLSVAARFSDGILTGDFLGSAPTGSVVNGILVSNLAGTGVGYIPIQLQS